MSTLSIEQPRSEQQTCPICSATFTLRGKHAGAHGVICPDCSSCRCGSGKPPGLCHGESRSRLLVAAS